MNKCRKISSLEVARRIDDWWSVAKAGVLTDPFAPMAKAGLFQIGLPGMGAGLDSYRAIAAAEQAIAAKTGLPGLASAFAGRQMVARFFLGGFANQDQRSAWLPRVAAGEVCVVIAISEPGAGAHPKNLQTMAEPNGAGYVVRGRKAWVTNGPVADVFLVLAVTAVEEGRKRYGLFLIPKGTRGLAVKPMPAMDVLAPATHCELELDGCELPATARIGDMADAYPAMALPFRDVEDTVGTANIAGLVSWLLRKISRPPRAIGRQRLAARPHRGPGIAAAGGKPARGGRARWRRAGCSGAGDRRPAPGKANRR